MFLDKDIALYSSHARIKLHKEGFEECFAVMDSREDIIRATRGMEVKCFDIMRDMRYPYVLLLPVEERIPTVFCRRPCFMRIGYRR
jgi:hypothetical protein